MESARSTSIEENSVSSLTAMAKEESTSASLVTFVLKFPTEENGLNAPRCTALMTDRKFLMLSSAKVAFSTTESANTS